jgi:hypothetical protein
LTFFRSDAPPIENAGVELLTGVVVAEAPKLGGGVPNEGEGLKPPFGDEKFPPALPKPPNVAVVCKLAEGEPKGPKDEDAGVTVELEDAPNDGIVDFPNDCVGAEEPNVGADVGAEEPNVGAEEPNVGAEEPNVGAEEPNVGAEEPNVGADVGAEEPNVGAEEPNVGAEEPNVSAAGAPEDVKGADGFEPNPPKVEEELAPIATDGDGSGFWFPPKPVLKPGAVEMEVDDDPNAVDV